MYINPKEKISDWGDPNDGFSVNSGAIYARSGYNYSYLSYDFGIRSISVLIAFFIGFG